MQDTQDALIGMLPARRGHCRLGSGHHGDLWLDLDALFLRPKQTGRFAQGLARRLPRTASTVSAVPCLGARSSPS
jgi:orotate phosphoribosyltransferase